MNERYEFLSGHLRLAALLAMEGRRTEAQEMMERHRCELEEWLAANRQGKEDEK